jgi:hypothetical protein
MQAAAEHTKGLYAELDTAKRKVEAMCGIGLACTCARLARLASSHPCFVTEFRSFRAYGLVSVDSRAALNATELYTIETQSATLQRAIIEERFARAAREVGLLAWSSSVTARFRP